MLYLLIFFSEEIKELFPRYGYQVRSFTNQNSKQILRLVRRYSKKENSGSLICFISSHGDQTSIACPDGSDVRINDILKKANTDQLRNCPKVFFIDACRKCFIIIVSTQLLVIYVCDINPQTFGKF